MTTRRWRVLLAVQMSLLAVCVAMVGAGCASADPSTTGAQQLHDVNQDSAEGQAILKAAAADVDGQMGKSAKFAVKSFKASDGWSFLSAQLQNPDGSPFDYAGTPLAKAAANGGASKRYVGLFRSNQNDGWDVVTSAVGATAPVWTEWAQKYSAPAELFGS
ncbi:hypothetical protein [Mycolicibacterium fortuitum]|uniref:hypothetical protein n=1 Tax=Mycolicibacterium fortuitum TaxID=1766 RepID=UPI0007EC412B|nr:hypothetical protein [Mycolicibacterium fortuitum]OBI75992.1 hypothetical protein A5664_23375 [Mycolicibacterium fortuitum]